MIVVETNEDDDDDYDDEVVNIPITVTILLLIMYILVGAAVFTVWEKDWTLVEGTYFSFITLSTIGFGDYVPGRNGPFDSVSIIIELLVGAIYCIFGLAMLSMCMNLIQDEITAKLHWIGNKIGISARRDSDNETDDSDSESDESESDTDSDATCNSSGASGSGNCHRHRHCRNRQHHSRATGAGAGRRSAIIKTPETAGAANSRKRIVRDTSA